MTGLVGSQGLFPLILEQIQMGRLTSGVQFQALSAVSQVLRSFPEGQRVSALIDNELQRSPGRIDYVSHPLREEIGASLPLLARAESSPMPSEAVKAVEKLRRIVALTSTSTLQMPAVLDPQSVHRVRDMTLPRVESPVTRCVERMIRSDMNSRRSIGIFIFNENIVHRAHWAGLLGFLSEHFGSEVTQEALEEMFSLPQEDYRVGKVIIRRERDLPLRIAGEIRNGKSMVGFCSMTVPSVPPRGRSWIAKVEVINLEQKHQRVGIGSQLLARAARFLNEKGVHAMQADAMEAAGLFCIFNGFRVPRAIYEEAVQEFIEEMGRQGTTIANDEIQTVLLNKDANLAELASFEVGGRRVGREFLQRLFTRRYLPVSFELNSDNLSWLRLLSNLHRNRPEIMPEEWERLQPATREMLHSGLGFVGGNVPEIMSSDSEHAHHLVERLTNWSTSMSMFLSLHQAMRGGVPEAMRLDIDHNMNAVQDVLEMIVSDTAAPLYSHFRHRMDPGKDVRISRDYEKDHGVVIAATLLSAEREGFLKIPAVLRALFEDLVSRE